MILNSPYISGSLTVTGNTNLMGALTVTGSLAGTATSSSFAYTASSAVSAYTAASAVNATTALTASYATSFTVGGTLTAQTLVVQTITSSVSFITGSTRFGSLLTNTHQFTGSLQITGSGPHYVFGNVGIGTASPVSTTGYTFTTTDAPVGSGYITKVNTATALYVYSNATDSRVAEQRALPLIFETNGTQRVSINAAGSSSFTANVLASAADAATINLKQNSTTANTGIYLERSGEQKGYYIYMGGSVDSLTFQRNNAGTKADVMSLTRDGNVGIGTTSPSFILDVRTGAGTSGTLLGLQNTTGANASNIVPIRFYAGNTFGGLEQIAAIWAGNLNAGANNGGTLYFGTSTNGTGTTPSEKMRLDNDGTLNLGTYHSTAKFLPGADSNHYLRYSTAIDGLELSGYSGLMFSSLGGTERMRITLGGNVGINTTSPSTTLQIRKNYWQFWVEKTHNANVNLFSITLPDFGAAIVTIGGSRYSPGADNYSGTSTYYIFVNNVGAVSVNGGSNFGTWTPTTSIASKTVTFASAYAGTSTNYSNASVVIQGSGHNAGSESALTVAVL